MSGRTRYLCTLASDLDGRILDLEHHLEQAKSLRGRISQNQTVEEKDLESAVHYLSRSDDLSTIHNTLLLGDSAIPLGSFAFSSGFESYLAHLRNNQKVDSTLRFNHFLSLSLASLSATTIPYVSAAYRGDQALGDLDNDLDASITCCVAKRASIAQGKALIALWDRSLKLHSESGAQASHQEKSSIARQRLESFAKAWKMQQSGSLGEISKLKGHLAPLFGILSSAMHVSFEQAIYLFVLNHAKALLSAAIRASVLGPYQAQSIQVSPFLKSQITGIVEAEVTNPRPTKDASQNVPMLDLWGGRHEIVYSRIFNS